MAAPAPLPPLPAAMAVPQPPQYNARPVLLAAAGTGVIAVVAAVIVTVVLMRERESRGLSGVPPTASTAPAAAPPETASAPPAPPSPPAPAPSLPIASASSAPEPEPEPGSVKFECTPEPCTALHCDGREYTDLTQSIELAPGEHRCIGSAEGYLPVVATFELEPKQALVRALELKKKGKPPAQHPRTSTHSTAPAAAKPGAASPCGTFINPCK